METNEQVQTIFERHNFTPEELERMKSHLELTGDREELMGWLDNYSYFLADWLILIHEAVNEFITRKQKAGIPCEEEHDMLRSLSFLFTKIAFFSGMITGWHKELSARKERIEEMIQNGHP